MSADITLPHFSVIDFSNQPNVETQVVNAQAITAAQAHEDEALPLQQGGLHAGPNAVGYNANASDVTHQAAHMAFIEDGVVELFIHALGHEKFIGARYLSLNGAVLREERFIKRLDDYAIPAMGTTYRYKASDDPIGPISVEGCRIPGTGRNSRYMYSGS